MVAPPFARHGLPKNPCNNRRTSRPLKLWTRAVGTERTTKTMKVIAYTGFRPIEGISLRGAKIIGPIPSRT